MYKIKVVIAVIAISLISTASHATNVWKNNVTLKGVQSLPDGGFILYLNSGELPNCSETRLMYAKPDTNGLTQEGLKTLQSISLTAYAAKKTVSIYYNSASAYCYINALYMRD